MTLGELFKEAYTRLLNQGLENPHLEATWIIEKYTNTDAVNRIRNPETGLSLESQNQVHAAVLRRLNGEPLAYILGEKGFYGLNFLVSPGVLIPRPETEILVDWAIQKVGELKKSHAKLNVLDLGGGSGCIGFSILKHCQDVELTYLDISSEALQVAKQNAHQLEILDRVEFVRLDAAKANLLLKKYSIVVANPPYIFEEKDEVATDVKMHEPRMALFSPQGVHHTKTWLAALPSILEASCAVGFEIGHNQSEQVTELFRKLKVFNKVYGIKDYAENNRFVCGDR